MNKQRNKFFAKLRHAREVLKSQDPRDVVLVKGVYDAMLHYFGIPDVMERLSDEEYVVEWGLCRVNIMRCLVDNHLITVDKFVAIWDAYDVITTEQAEAFA